LILFTHPSVQLTVTDPTVPVLTIKDAKDYVRKAVADGARFDQDTYDVLADLFDEAQGAEEVSMPDEAEPADGKTKRRKVKKE
jgi:hypothetical protein